MRIVTAICLCGLLAGAATAKEKGPDTVNAGPDKVYTLTFAGSLDAGSGTYDRIYTDAVNLQCGASTSDSANDGMAFELVCLEVNDYQPIELILDPGQTNIVDTVMTLYCDPFDPSLPGANVIAYDDDDGMDTLSAITLADNIHLMPGQKYWLVVSTYGAGMYGDFTVQTSDNVFACGSVPLERTSWGALKGQYR